MTLHITVLVSCIDVSGICLWICVTLVYFHQRSSIHVCNNICQTFNVRCEISIITWTVYWIYNLDMTKINQTGHDAGIFVKAIEINKNYKCPIMLVAKSKSINWYLKCTWVWLDFGVMSTRVEHVQLVANSMKVSDNSLWINNVMICILFWSRMYHILCYPIYIIRLNNIYLFSSRLL